MVVALARPYANPVQPYERLSSTDAQRRQVICKQMVRFFSDKAYALPNRDGDPQTVPLALLLSPTNVRLVECANEMALAMDMIEVAIDRHLRGGRQLIYHPIRSNKDHILFNLWLVKECGAKRVIKEFMGGIMLLYTWLCEGVDIHSGAA